MSIIYNDRHGRLHPNRRFSAPNPASRQAQERTRNSSARHCSKSNAQTSLRGTALGKHTRSGTCTRDPVGYADGLNVYRSQTSYNDPMGLEIWKDFSKGCQLLGEGEDCAWICGTIACGMGETCRPLAEKRSLDYGIAHGLSATRSCASPLSLECVRYRKHLER